MSSQIENINKKKVLILYNKLFHYRIPIFNLLASKYDLTVSYSYNTSEYVIAQCNFKTIFIPIFRFWKVTIHKKNILRLAKGYDVVIAYGDTAWLSFSSLALLRRNFKLFFWTIGAPASYNRRYGEANRLHYLITDFFDKRADGLIVYSDRPVKMFKERGITSIPFFRAHNTVKVRKIELNNTLKNKILFIGTLYMEKGLEILLDSYLEAYKVSRSIPELLIIGGGDQYDSVNKWIDCKNLSDKIKLLGPIYSEEEKSNLFSQAIACISPLQAGLSVLESMGYGVPFITMKDAITGGEAFNIVHEKNGLRLDDVEQFKEVIIDISNNRCKYLEFGKNAYEYYWEYRKPEDMVQGLIDAIENV